MPESITFESLITPAGALVAAAAIKLLVDLLKAVIPGVDARISGALLAFILSAVLYATAALALPSLGNALNANGYLGIVLSWLGCATGAIGMTSAIRHATAVSREHAVEVLTTPSEGPV